MNVVKCDRCGAVLPNEVYSQISARERVFRGMQGSSADVSKDLCPTCVVSFIRWWSNPDVLGELGERKMKK